MGASEATFFCVKCPLTFAGGTWMSQEVSKWLVSRL